MLNNSGFLTNQIIYLHSFIPMITNKCGTLICHFMLSFYYYFCSPFERFSIAFERGGKCDIDELDLYLKNVQMYMFCWFFFHLNASAFERGGKCYLDALNLCLKNVQVDFDHWFSQCLCMSAINCSN